METPTADILYSGRSRFKSYYVVWKQTDAEQEKKAKKV